MSALKQLSIVIPIGPGDNSWQTLLQDLQRFGPEIEIILSACDKATGYPLPTNAIWLQSNAQRAEQLNNGAAQASRAFVWFLHADSGLSESAANTVSGFIQSEPQALGYFPLQFAEDGPSLMFLNSWGANLRARYLNLPFGDQGFLIKTALFKQLGGFDQSIPLGEDLDFVVRLKHHGIALIALPDRLSTSARRYQQQGWLTTSVRFIGLTGLLTWQAKSRLRRPR